MGVPTVEIVNEESPLFKKKEPSARDEGNGATTKSSLQKFLSHKAVIALAVFAALLLGWTCIQRHLANESTEEVSASKITRVAFLGNSMFYFNDFPRFFQAMAARDHHVEQNSCLHGGASIPSLVLEGNAMYPQFGTDKAILEKATQKYYPDNSNRQDDNDSSSSSSNSSSQSVIYDYGACTVPQLLTGKDDRLDDPGYAQPEDKITSKNRNPCREDSIYLQFAKDYFEQEIAEYANGTEDNNGDDNDNDDHYWDYILLNDNTRNPSRRMSRERTLAFLESFYVPWLLETKATPVFLWTHAYSVPSTSTRNMTGLEDVSNFTSLTGVGYRAYKELLEQHLPPSQQPRIAPVGLAFLMVYEENPELWEQLFHSDHIHASPSGSFLQGCVVYHTLFGEMPPYKWVVRRDVKGGGMKSLWKTARMMQHASEPPNPFPTTETAAYLYDIAKRIMVHGEVPNSYINYQNGEVATVWEED